MDPLLSCLQAVASTAQRVEHENRLVNQYTARDFTPFRFMAWSEVPSTHMLAFFLNPDETHGQGTLFQDIFFEHLRQLPLLGPRLPRTRWTVEAERRHGDTGQIDLLLTTVDRQFAICVENKPRDKTGDQHRQLTRYRRFLKQRHGRHYALVYLSSIPRRPQSHSLRPSLRWRLIKSGHYVNITYQSFILTVIDAWQRAVHPESLRLFLGNFRHQIEQWLNFPSTKPAQLMQDKEVVKTLIAIPAYVHTAFDIASALDTLKHRLRDQLAQKLGSTIPDIEGAVHWKWKGFVDGDDGNPFLLRRTLLNSSSAPACWLWGRYAIAIELNEGRLIYGIRFDKNFWFPGDSSVEQPIPTGVPEQLASMLGDKSQHTDWWPWWEWAGPTTEKDLYSAIAEGTLVKKLQQEVLRLASVLDRYTSLVNTKDVDFMLSAD
ncbi:PDDEXK-like family protein [Hymenobacter fodinae]|uniref:PD-(D/E)XK nuclease superfamily protein n=1 Tax=Hymenobacter fodinae TaxID=2510796 RepID=A0A4Z0NY83_9BACT|nr:PD-(D/E)XK nuclease family protein [Hymenobacter fodinae]TGE03320.1 hypothetical protein EU556_25730 [Hymenobacter fodinae]